LDGGEVVGVGTVEAVFGEGAGRQYRQGQGQDQFVFHGRCSSGIDGLLCSMGFMLRRLIRLKSAKSSANKSTFSICLMCRYLRSITSGVPFRERRKTLRHPSKDASAEL